LTYINAVKIPRQIIIKCATCQNTRASGSGTPAVESGSFSDTQMFMTTLTGGVTPSFQINPVGKQWGLATGTNFGLTVTRTDHHNLQVGLSLVEPGESTTEVAIVSNTPRASVLVTSGRLAPSALQKHTVTKAEQRVLDVMTQQRIDNYLIHFGRFKPCNDGNREPSNSAPHPAPPPIRTGGRPRQPESRVFTPQRLPIGSRYLLPDCASPFRQRKIL
jgi:hypothetical protein